MHRGDRTAAVLVLTALVLFVAACAASQPAPAAGEPVPGFLLGFWHGLIAPVAFLIGLFGEGVRMYAFPNAGAWYDFGFMIGIGGFSGGIFAGSRSKRAG
jgi:hypothetical protein